MHVYHIIPYTLYHAGFLEQKDHRDLNASSSEVFLQFQLDLCGVGANAASSIEQSEYIVEQSTS